MIKFHYKKSFEFKFFIWIDFLNEIALLSSLIANHEKVVSINYDYGYASLMTKTRKREHICYVHFRTFHHDSTQKNSVSHQSNDFYDALKALSLCVMTKWNRTYLNVIYLWYIYSFSHYEESLVPFRYKLNLIKNMILKQSELIFFYSDIIYYDNILT